MNDTTINFNIYEDAVEFYGSAKVKLPDISFMTNTVTGAGIAGEYESVIVGMVSAMGMTIDFRSITKKVVKLYEPRKHTLDIRAAQQSDDSSGISVTKEKYVVVATPKKMGLGSLAPASPAEASGDFSVSYLAKYIDGVKVVEIDQLNYICMINGTDYLADVRTALGK